MSAAMKTKHVQFLRSVCHRSAAPFSWRDVAPLLDMQLVAIAVPAAVSRAPLACHFAITHAGIRALARRKEYRQETDQW
jgi:hypothetical protein